MAGILFFGTQCTYPRYGEFFDLSDLRVGDDVMVEGDLWINVEKFFFQRSNVEDRFMPAIAAHQLIAFRST